MKTKSPAATPAISQAGVVVALVLLALPALCQAKASATGGFQKFEQPSLLTPADFIEAAASQKVDIHELYFELRPYEGTGTCLMCHEEDGLQMLDSGHFKWRGKVENIVGLKGAQYGKRDLINNLCISTASNEGRCTQCHTGYGWADANYDFSNPENVDCLACHDQSGTYSKNPKTAGMPNPGVDLQAVAASVRIGSQPTRKACLACHANAGGGDNVKHGDLSTDLIATTREYDVHMGTDGANMNCIACHGSNHDPKTGDVNHGIAGMPLHSVFEGEMKQCTDCHGSQSSIHANTGAAEWLANETWHENLACQVCHIPAIARKNATKLEWYWETAGDGNRVPVTDPETGKPDYDKMKGDFVWGLNVRPALRYFNGTWRRKVVNVTDTYTSEPIDMGSPVGDYSDPKAMIYPFKVLTGTQPVDPVNKLVLVPHLFGQAGGPNPYWEKWDWNAAIIDAAAITGQDYSGTYAWGATIQMFTVNHEVAPASEALGSGIIPDACMDCHQQGMVDFTALGWTADPLEGGVRDTTAAPVENDASLLSAEETSVLR